MSREVTIKIRQTIDPTVGDCVFGTLWHWTVQEEGVLYPRRYDSGFARTEQGARRKAERVAARIMEGTVLYTYNPAGLNRP